ncbi:MAG TPA: AraC family transcriptional regulator [Anaerolineae bacterium]
MTTLEQLSSVRTYIDDHYDQPLSTAELARRAHLSRYHFIRLFRRFFRETPHQYLIRQRLDQAKYLLANSTLPVTDICFAVGFESIGSFSTLFHKSIGWAPSVYRARVWEQRHNPYKFIPGCFCTMYNLTASENGKSS